MARLRRYCGSYILEINNGKFREYCGPYLYEIEGFVSRQEMMALIAILFA